MTDAKIGAVVVLDQQKLVGIFTERDVLVRVVGGGRDPSTTRVSEVMTSAVRSVEPTTPIDETLRVMSERRHRHMPVVENNEVRGLISMGDVTRWVIRSQQEQVDLAIGAVKRMGIANRRVEIVSISFRVFRGRIIHRRNAPDRIAQREPARVASRFA
jgi:signal-transduction protein with cAMP-binding, CBS, and nucleotidyltransferase domain